MPKSRTYASCRIAPASVRQALTSCCGARRCTRRYAQHAPRPVNAARRAANAWPMATSSCIAAPRSAANVPHPVARWPRWLPNAPGTCSCQETARCEIPAGLLVLQQRVMVPQEKRIAPRPPFPSVYNVLIIDNPTDSETRYNGGAFFMDNLCPGACVSTRGIPR